MGTDEEPPRIRGRETKKGEKMNTKEAKGILTVSVRVTGGKIHVMGIASDKEGKLAEPFWAMVGKNEAEETVMNLVREFIAKQ